MFYFRDNPQVDIVGANLYDRFLQQSWSNRLNGNGPYVVLPKSRLIPSQDILYEQTVTKMESLLVGTGVYKPESETTVKTGSETYHGHRDLDNEPSLTKPSRFVPDVLDGIRHIFEREQFSIVT